MTKNSVLSFSSIPIGSVFFRVKIGQVSSSIYKKVSNLSAVCLSTNQKVSFSSPRLQKTLVVIL